MHIRTLSAASAFTLVLLPTHVPRWLDGVAPTPQQPLTVVRGTIEPRSTLAAALSDTLTPAAVHDLVQAARPVHDLARVAVGRPYGVALDADGALHAFTYSIDELRTLRVRRSGGELAAELLQREYEVELAAVAGRIESSLFATIGAIGERDQLALDLAEIFAWDVDFNTEIRKGDSFRAAVEKLRLDGRFVRYGRVLAAEFVRGPRLLTALRFDGAAGGGYYTPDGTPLRKAFLRSPLRFSRITSGFTHARFHPILRTTRPHYGIDYAAPMGTPVVAAGNGVVTLAGWHGGYGKAVKLRHANGYETLYGHLSRIDVRKGQRVRQGARIGAVGKTGLATGPHLDYRMLRGGRYVNPLAVRSPPAEPLAPDELKAFAALRAERLGLLESAARPSPLEPAARQEVARGGSGGASAGRAGRAGAEAAEAAAR